MLPAVFGFCAEMGRVFAPAGLLRIGERERDFWQSLTRVYDRLRGLGAIFALYPSVSLPLHSVRERSLPTGHLRYYWCLEFVKSCCILPHV